jgi:hypothetical protein
MELYGNRELVSISTDLLSGSWTVVSKRQILFDPLGNVKRQAIEEVARLLFLSVPSEQERIVRGTE